MTQEFLPLLANHLWQSTLAAAVVWLLTLVLRKNAARLRYWLWLAASLKFLIPVSLLLAIGARVELRPVPTPPQPTPFAATVNQVALPFTPVILSSRVLASVPRAAHPLPSILAGIWACGFVVVSAWWLIPWLRIRAIVRAAPLLRLRYLIPVRSSSQLHEPSVFGILNPVLLLPEGIEASLTPAQFQAILTHELCHIRRRDNLTAALHMLVETLFWFHPLVWWMGRRLVEERERACDEAVLSLTSEPRAYAEGILKVCELYLASPSTLIAGVTGANLKQRIEAIMANRSAPKLNLSRKLLLAAAGLAAAAGPVAFGVFNAPQLRGQAAPDSDPPRSIAVASIRPASYPNEDFFRGFTATSGACGIGARRPGISGIGLNLPKMSLCMLIGMAYEVQDFRISGAPAWMMKVEQSNFYDVQIKAEGETPLTDSQARALLRALLADRFQVKLHRDTKTFPVYELAIGKNGAKFKETPVEDRAQRNGVAMKSYVAFISAFVDRPIVDKTGLTGTHYQFQWDEKELREDLKQGILPVPSIFREVEQQLGLTLKTANDPMDVLVIDHAEPPSAN